MGYIKYCYRINLSLFEVPYLSNVFQMVVYLILIEVGLQSLMSSCHSDSYPDVITDFIISQQAGRFGHRSRSAGTIGRTADVVDSRID